MRAYTFTNFYLSSLAKGIQSAHAIVDIGRKYKDKCELLSQYNDWADHHKTIIVLNGGNSGMLESIIELFVSHQDKYPWCEFHEDEQSLNGALTVVGIILPESIYALAERVRGKGINDWSFIARYFEDNDLEVYGKQLVMPALNAEEFEPYTIDKCDYEIVTLLNRCGLAS